MKTQPDEIAAILWEWESDEDFAAVEKDIKEAIEDGSDDEWYSPLKPMSLVTDRWVENTGYPEKYINALMYGQVQGEHQRELSRYDEEDWREHLRRKADGIE